MTENVDTQNNKKWGAIAERISIGILVALTLGSYLDRAKESTKLAVMLEVQRRQGEVLMEVQRRQAALAETRAIQEARLAFIEKTRFTPTDAQKKHDEARERFDAQLLEIYTRLNDFKDEVTTARSKERDRFDTLLQPILDRLRACEDKK